LVSCYSCYSILVYTLNFHICYIYLFLMIQQTPLSTLFPYTTLFRSSPHRSSTAMPAWDEWSLALTGCAVARSSCSIRIRPATSRSEEHTSELQSRENLVCRLLLEKKK